MSLSAPTPIILDGAPFSLGIVAARFNSALVDALLHTVFENLVTAGVKAKRITVVRVPGSHEVPWAANLLARRRGCDGVIGLGVLIAGDTNHHAMVGQSVSQALQQVALESGTPVINGVMVVDSRKQAEERCVGTINRGAEFARAALEMAALKRSFSGIARQPGSRGGKS
jgi:6,7-dimethyl-8-ribityllumazine synthase